ncbi:MAG: primosomal protein N' [Planctomycetota bacterium]|nr:MAG: primosomal protein N' [Planctomycetota bacterium]
MRPMATGVQQASLFPEPEEKASPATGAGFARVALDLPTRTEFSYRIPPGFEGVEVGCRVYVPLAKRRVLGVVVGLDPHPPEGIPFNRIRDLQEWLDPEPLLTPSLLLLARFMADRSFCSWGNALAAMLPAVLRKARARRSIPQVELKHWPGEDLRRELERKFPKQERALAFLKAAGGPVDLREFRTRTGLSRSPLESLYRKGWVRFLKRTASSDPFAGNPVEAASPHVLNQSQQACLDAILPDLDARQHRDFLLFGVTGSGKTEVYLQAMERALSLGLGAIIVVPEIALTPQTVQRFRSRSAKVAVLHSGLTDAERYDQWKSIRHGEAKVVVGARSALFAPVNPLGLLVVDEEHESSFKQEQAPRYHAREVARERARLENAVCILGSATPSLESWLAADQGDLHLLELPDRVAGGQLPQVRLVDMRHEKPEKGHWAVVSRPLRNALETCFHGGHQAILFLNQRGFSPAWHCRHCGQSVHCPDCEVSLTFHRWRKRALCHYCLQEFPPPERCPECQAQVQPVGVGTERAEDAVRRLFPEARVARMDRDTMLRRDAYEALLRDFGAGRFDLLLGTQMVAKGLDFPNVTVVGVLNADIALHHPDFRAAERCFNLVAQVSGRAGRGTHPGQVVVQTWLPEHPSIQAAMRHDYRRFARQEMADRRSFGYPPWVRAVQILVEGKEEGKVESLACEIADRLRQVQTKSSQILGPAPPPVARLRGVHRRQLLVKTSSKGMPKDLAAVLYDLCQRPGITLDPL